MKYCRFVVLSMGAGLSLLSAVAAMTETVGCGSHAVMFDLERRGQVVGIRTAAGTELAVDIDSKANVFENSTELFEIELRKVDDYTCERKAYPRQARKMLVDKIDGGLNLTYSEFGEDSLRKVVCSVRPDGGKLRWRIRVEPAPGWAVTLAAYPLLALTPRIGASGEDDTLVSGHSFREGLERNPGARKWKRYGKQPGSLGVQLACYCDPKALFLYCAEDGAGEAKSLKIQSAAGRGILFRFAWIDWLAAEAAQPYDVVTACKDAKDGDEPLSWHDGADIYKAWAVKQRWCQTPTKYRTDLPAWLKGSPVHANLYDWRGWCRRPHALEDWAEKYWEKNFPNSTVNLHFDGWERDGVYVMTDYFPLHPDNETFAGHAKALANHRVYLFPWPSGYLRAAAFDKRPDGTFKVDEREAFARTFAPHACKMPDGSLHDAHYKWLKGGAVSSMCGGDPWTVDWFAHDVCGRIADLGVPTLSCDQNVGGGFPACWDRTHPHPPGEGRWINDVARRQAGECLKALRVRFPETAAFCFEEANEHLNDVVSYSYSREPYDPDREWANVFTYLYHEYVPIYPTLGGVCRFSDAYALTAGLMPRLKPRFSDFDPSAKPKAKAKNGKKSSEDPTALWNELVTDLDDEARTRFVRRWVSLYSGEGREWLMFGRRVKPPRIDCASVSFGGTNRLAVFVGAYESLDGRRALVFANGTDAAQRVTWRRGGRTHELTLAPYEVQLLPEDDLLKRWADGLIALQVGEFARPELKGGMLCPACGLLHGRIGDVAYPFAHLYVKTGDAKYLKGAEAAVDWCERNMLLPTGLYRNDRQSYWRSTTAFCAIPLWKALRDYGEKLPAATTAKWRRILHRQLVALYELYEHDPDFKAVINYYSVYPEAMHIAWKELGDEKYFAAAKRQAKEILEQAFNKDGFLIGEGNLNGSIYGTSARGCNLVDFGYNLEESLTAIIEYANMVGDAALRAKAVDSAKRQLEFVLPDGAIDNSCGSRSVKWTYYGSRTSDGILTLLTLLKDDIPYAARMAERVVDLYTRCTGPDGLIRGGYMYDEAEEPACVHHAFARAKTLVEYERSPLSSRPLNSQLLPRERQYGDKYFPTIDTHLVSIGPWRATVSANDAFNLAARRSAAISGGTMSMLWHEALGPVFVGTLGEYFYAEPHNMQDDRHDMKMHCLAPRIVKGKASNIFDYETQAKGGMTGGRFTYTATGKLTAPTGGKGAGYSLAYALDGNGLEIRVKADDPAAQYVLPLIAGLNDKVTVEGKTATVLRQGMRITLTATVPISIAPCDRGDRIWSPTSGMLCVPLTVPLAGPVVLTLHCTRSDPAGEVEATALWKAFRERTDRRIAEIRATPNPVMPAGAAVYYVSPKGDDAKDGRTPATAWRTVQHVNRQRNIKPGSFVLFERGGFWRVSLDLDHWPTNKPFTGYAGGLKGLTGVTYSAYGEGPKPVLTTSPFNGADPARWQTTDAKDVWACPLGRTDVGCIVFDEGAAHAVKILPVYHKDGKTTAQYTNRPFKDYRDLEGDLHFYHDYTTNGIGRGTGILYLKSAENPGKRFKSIEFGIRHNIITSHGRDNVVYDNLCLRYGGAHGIHHGSATNLMVQNCEFGWIGGGIQGEGLFGRAWGVRYGNAVETGSCDGYTITNCYVYQIYDAGLTHQSDAISRFNGKERVFCQKRIRYVGNVIEKCNYSIEYFLSRCPETNPSRMEDFLIADNLMWDCGKGLCEQRPDRTQDAHIKSWVHSNRAKGYAVRNNVFAGAHRQLVEIGSDLRNADGSDSMPHLEDNVFIASSSARLGTVAQLSSLKDRPVYWSMSKEAEAKLNALGRGNRVYVLPPAL